MLDLLKLKTFRTVALKKNFTRAAAELGYSQSNVTTHIKSLEQELGAPLFNRFRFANRIVLTEAGRRIFEYAGQLLAWADETKAAVRKEGEPAGLFRTHALLIEKNNIHRVLIDHAMSPAPSRKTRMVDVGTLEAVKRCAMAGMGVAVLPHGFITSELEQGKLAPLMWTGEAPAVYTQMLHSREQWASPTLRAFWSLAREEFSRA